MIIAVIFSFNAGKSRTVWQGFSMRWYYGDKLRSVWYDDSLHTALVHTLWLGLLAIVFLGGQLGWFPQGGMYDLSKRDVFDPLDRLRHLVLPALILASAGWVGLSRVMRGETLEVLNQDFIRTARAKGMAQSPILFVHALKNAAVPIVTVIGLGVAGLIGGAVVTESVFAMPGIGLLVADAILRRDYPVIQGVVLIFSFVYVLVNLGVDLTYALLDPRIRY